MRGLEHMSTFVVDAPVENGIDFLDLHLRQMKPKVAAQ
jgi:hypothetical protein